VAEATKQPGELARRIHEFLRRTNATAPDRAVTDREIASRVHCPIRDVVDHAAELLGAGIPVVASCGSSRDGRGGKGRYLENDPAKLKEYGDSLKRRGVSVLRRRQLVMRCRRLMLERMSIEPTGQRRLFQ